MGTVYPLVIGREAVISTQHYLSASAGARVFARGGNAIDAAIAATLVEGIVNPHMHTIGGEAPMLIRSAQTGRVVSINGNMKAPARATVEELRARGISKIPAHGLIAAGVPAALDAMVTALIHFGTRSFAEVAEPALALAEDGFPVHVGLSGEDGVMKEYAGAGASIRAFERIFRTKYPSTAKIYMPEGKPPRPGDIIRNPALGRFFRRLLDAEAGARGQGREAALAAVRERFYSGDIAREIAAWSDANGGLLAESDLSGFSTRIEEPVSVEYRGVTVFKCGPWSQGPVFLQQLRLLEGFDLRTMGHNSADYVHTVIEAAKLAFADREAYYADPEFTRVPMEGLLSARYAELRRPLIDPARASIELRPGDPIGMRALHDAAGGDARSWGPGTVHVAAGDRAGNVIAVTASGAWIPTSPVIESLGFPLGTRIQTFYLDQAHPNVVAPGKRPRTTLSPSMAMRGAESYLGFGTPGGDQQDQWTLQFFLNVVEFGMNLQEAIEAPKFSTAHFPSSFYPHEAAPGLIHVEDRIDASVRRELEGRGHKVEVTPAWSEGHVLAVAVDRARGIVEGGCDPRGQARPVMAAQTIGW